MGNHDDPSYFNEEKLQCDIEDMSFVYASYNDVNDWLVATK